MEGFDARDYLSLRRRFRLSHQDVYARMPRSDRVPVAELKAWDTRAKEHIPEVRRRAIYRAMQDCVLECCRLVIADITADREKEAAE